MGTLTDIRESMVSTIDQGIIISKFFGDLPNRIQNIGLSSSSGLIGRSVTYFAV